ncbi:MAG: phosphoribosylanthranilate isomerase [Trueperaceae bacterium]|nr:phosphoribosylanthranilate isomerase [Trueperaceae bacterium]
MSRAFAGPAPLERGRVRVKVCGVTRPEDAIAVEAAGADAVGVIFAAGSRRRVDVARAAEVLAPLGPFVTRVGVFVSPTADDVLAAVGALRLHAVQLHGELAGGDGAFLAALRGRVAVIRAVAWSPGLDLDAWARSPADALLVDGPRAGSGRPFDWAGAHGLRRLSSWVLAGGLTPENVAQAIARLAPPAVDVASGVESAPGTKDARRLAAFMAAVRGAEAGLGRGRRSPGAADGVV